MYSLSDFDFNLPPERIAQFPLPDRSASRLLHLDGAQLIDRQFADIVGLLQAGDLLVMNDTRVLKARFFGVKESGGKIEALVERVLDDRTVLAQVRASKSPPPGCKIRLADAFDVTVGERAGEFFTLHFDADVFELIEAHGRLPLPPYIEHTADALLLVAGGDDDGKLRLKCSLCALHAFEWFDLIPARPRNSPLRSRRAGLPRPARLLRWHRL